MPQNVCPKCNGTCRVLIVAEEFCHICYGDGYVNNHMCHECHGKRKKRYCKHKTCDHCFGNGNIHY